MVFRDMIVEKCTLSNHVTNLSYAIVGASFLHSLVT